MTPIKEILHALATSDHPVARVIHKSEHFKVLAIGFKSGMLLKDHQAYRPTKLTVLEGSVVYRESDCEVTLDQYDEMDIPVDVTHQVEASKASLCVLTQG